MPHFKDANNELYWLDDGDDPAVWLPQCTPITDAEAQVMREAKNAQTYAEKRAAEYPPMQDYLDGVVKGDQAQIEKYIADCLAVKAKYPK